MAVLIVGVIKLGRQGFVLRREGKEASCSRPHGRHRHRLRFPQALALAGRGQSWVTGVTTARCRRFWALPWWRWHWGLAPLQGHAAGALLIKVLTCQLPKADRPESGATRHTGSRVRLAHVQMSGSDVTIHWPNGASSRIPAGSDWLGAAASAGLRIPTGCLNGSCGACEIDVDGETVRACIGTVPASEKGVLEVELFSDPTWDLSCRS